MAANAATGNRWQQRNRGSFVPRSELSSEQQAILAAVPTFKRTWVRPSFLKPHQRPNYKICKWVIDTTPSTRIEFDNEMPRERKAGVPLTGASTVHHSTPTPTPTLTPVSIPNPTAVIDLTGGGTTPASTPAPAPARAAPVIESVEATPIAPPVPTASTSTPVILLPPTTTTMADPPLPSLLSASKPAQGTPPSNPTALRQIAEAVKDDQGDEVQKSEEQAAVEAEAAVGGGRC